MAKLHGKHFEHGSLKDWSGATENPMTWRVNRQTGKIEWIAMVVMMLSGISAVVVALTDASDWLYLPLAFILVLGGRICVEIDVLERLVDADASEEFKAGFHAGQHDGWEARGESDRKRAVQRVANGQ